MDPSPLGGVAFPTPPRSLVAPGAVARTGQRGGRSFADTLGREAGTPHDADDDDAAADDEAPGAGSDRSDAAVRARQEQLERIARGATGSADDGRPHVDLVV